MAVGWLAKLLGGGGSKIVESVGGVLDNLITNKEELAQAKLELAKEVNRNIEVLQADATHQFELEIQDKNSARTRETEFVKATGHIDWMHTVVGIAVMISFILTTYLLFTVELPVKSEHIVINLVGILEGAVITVVGYYYGSSAGSRIKDMKSKG